MNIFPISSEHINYKLAALEKKKMKELKNKIENISDPELREVLKALNEKKECKCMHRMMGHE